MTELHELDENVELNPEAPRPPFGVYLDLPAEWTLLDTNPATWERSARNMLDTTFRRSRLTAAERREVIGFFEQLVADCQQAGAAVSLILVGRLSEGKAASLGLHLAFADEKRPASLGAIRDSLPRTGTVDELDSGVGPALLHRERMTMVPPGASDLVALTSMQVFVPFPGTTWTAALATASAYPELTEPMELLLRRVVASLHTDESAADDATAGITSDAAAGTASNGTADDFVETPRVSGPGIERGFTTLVRKRMNASGDRTDPASDDAAE